MEDTELEALEYRGGHLSQGQADEFALGTLAPPETPRIEAHLSGCASCQALVDDALGISGQLALAVPSNPAPAGLKHRVLSSAGLVRQPAWRRVAHRLPMALAAAAAVLAIAALGGFFVVRAQVDDLRHQNKQLQAQLESTRQQQRADAANNSLVAALVSPGSVMAPIMPANASGIAAGRLVWNDQQAKCWLVIDKLPALPPGETYQLWAESDGTFWSLGTFSTSATGLVAYTAHVSHDIADYNRAAITVEKAGGSTTMTGQPIYWADLSDATSEYE